MWASQMLLREVYEVLVVRVLLGHHQRVLWLVRAESAVFVRVLGLDVSRETAQQRVQVQWQGRRFGHLLLQPLLGTVQHCQRVDLTIGAAAEAGNASANRVGLVRLLVGLLLLLVMLLLLSPAESVEVLKYTRI